MKWCMFSPHLDNNNQFYFLKNSVGLDRHLRNLSSSGLNISLVLSMSAFRRSVGSLQNPGLQAGHVHCLQRFLWAIVRQ